MLNHCTFIGNVGKEPEIRDVGGSKVASFSIACTEKWKDKNGDRKEKTEWVNCSAWGALAVIVEQYVNKGSKLYIAGRLETREYEKDGQKRYATQINVNTLKMLDGRTNNQKPDEEQRQDQGEIDDTIPF